MTNDAIVFVGYVLNFLDKFDNLNESYQGKYTSLGNCELF